jgi:hypothetical protein
MGKPRHEQGAATSLNHRTASPSATAGNRRQQKWVRDMKPPPSTTVTAPSN